MLESGYFDSEIIGYDEEGMPEFDRAKSSDFLALFISKLITSGVLAVPGDCFQVLAHEGMKLRIRPGFAFIRGRFALDQQEAEITIPTAPTSNKRIDRVVLRANYLNRNCEIVIKEGVPGAEPVPPELLQPESGDYYELCLATILVKMNQTSISQAGITDTRYDSRVCGIVTQAIDHLDTSVFFAQFNQFYEEFVEQTGISYAQFVADMERYLNELTASGNRRLNEIVDKMTEFEETSEIQFLEWFEQMKDQLSEDAAGNLQLQIDTLTEGVEDIQTMISSGQTVYVDATSNALKQDGTENFPFKTLAQAIAMVPASATVDSFVVIVKNATENLEISINKKNLTIIFTKEYKLIDEMNQIYETSFAKLFANIRISNRSNVKMKTTGLQIGDYEEPFELYNQKSLILVENSKFEIYSDSDSDTIMTYLSPMPYTTKKIPLFIEAKNSEILLRNINFEGGYTSGFYSDENTHFMEFSNSRVDGDFYANYCEFNSETSETQKYQALFTNGSVGNLKIKKTVNRAYNVLNCSHVNIYSMSDGNPIFSVSNDSRVNIGEMPYGRTMLTSTYGSAENTVTGILKYAADLAKKHESELTSYVATGSVKFPSTSIPASSEATLKLAIPAKTGYKLVCLTTGNTGNKNLVFRALYTSNGEAVAVIRNLSTAAVTASSATAIVLYQRT